MHGFQKGKNAGTGHVSSTSKYTMPGWLLQRDYLVSPVHPPKMSWKEKPRRHALSHVRKDNDIRNRPAWHIKSMCNVYLR